MDQPHSTDSLPVTQAPGDPQNVQRDTWARFLNGNNFIGVYRPNAAPSSTDRDNFVAMGRLLVTQNIPYSLAYQVNYDVSQTGRTWVMPSDITGMRCDGVVEYIFEYYGFRVTGADYWDVSRWGDLYRGQHSITAVDPRAITYIFSMIGYLLGKIFIRLTSSKV